MWSESEAKSTAELSATSSTTGRGGRKRKLLGCAFAACVNPLSFGWSGSSSNSCETLLQSRCPWSSRFGRDARTAMRIKKKLDRIGGIPQKLIGNKPLISSSRTKSFPSSNFIFSFGDQPNADEYSDENVRAVLEFYQSSRTSNKMADWVADSLFLKFHILDHCEIFLWVIQTCRSDLSLDNFTKCSEICLSKMIKNYSQEKNRDDQSSYSNIKFEENCESGIEGMSPFKIEDFKNYYNSNTGNQNSLFEFLNDFKNGCSNDSVFYKKDKNDLKPEKRDSGFNEDILFDDNSTQLKTTLEPQEEVSVSQDIHKNKYNNNKNYNNNNNNNQVVKNMTQIENEYIGVRKEGTYQRSSHYVRRTDELLYLKRIRRIFEHRLESRPDELKKLLKLWNLLFYLVENQECNNRETL